MVSTEDLARLLGALLPDELVTTDLRRILFDPSVADRRIEIGRRKIAVPEDADLEVIAKSFIVDERQINFGTGFRAQVAVGGVVSEHHGIVSARYCFATLYYNATPRMFTIDFHAAVR